MRNLSGITVRPAVTKPTLRLHDVTADMALAMLTDVVRYPGKTPEMGVNHTADIQWAIAYPATVPLPAMTGRIATLNEVDKYAIPVTIEEALNGPYAQFWLQAILEELASLQQNGTWVLVPRTAGMKVLPCKWVFTIKTDADGRPTRFKARLVAGGHRQVEGIDYEETYAPVSRHTTLRTFLSVAARRRWKVHQVDIKTAFLYGDIDTEVYMMQPPGFVDGTNLVCLLKKCLYGLKQAPKRWYEKLMESLVKLGFEPVAADRSFWVRKGDTGMVYLTSVVDDMLIACEDESVTLSIIAALFKEFEGKHSGIASHYVGMKLTWLDHEPAVILTQAAHVQEALDKFEQFMPDSSPKMIPMEAGLKMSMSGTSNDPTSPLLDVTRYPYRSLVGTLNYLACCTRPDIAYAVNQLAKYSNAPTEAHWETGLKCLRYLKGTMNWGLKLGHLPGIQHAIPNSSIKKLYEVCAYSDSNHGTGVDSKRSVSGSVIQVYGGAVFWSSRNQSLTSTSSTESEYRALSDLSKECLWLAKLLPLFKLRDYPFLIFTDSNGALSSATNYAQTRNTKHIEIHLDFMRDRHQVGHLLYQHVEGRDNPADMFTKALPLPQFSKFRERIGMVSL
jgi:histone deacetylase 1/2